MPRKRGKKLRLLHRLPPLQRLRPRESELSKKRQLLPLKPKD